jgi:bis(5'-nucleosidyl)-tetraphosphatase
MSPLNERSAGVIPYWIDNDGTPHYLILHSATVRNPRARWEFPKGGMEDGETNRATAEREFKEETSLSDWSFREGFERSLSYTYLRQGRKVYKTVTYFLACVRDRDSLACSPEHVPDASGNWYQWAPFDEIHRYLFHSKIRQLFAEAHEWLRINP